MFVDPAHLTGWESCVWEYVILQNRGLVLAGTILILRTQILPNLHQYSHDRMSQLLLKLLYTASSHLALRLSLKKIKKKEIDCNASAYCREHWCARHGWFQRWLICGGDQRKSRQDQKRKQRQSVSEGIIKRVKGDDAEPRLAKQRQRMANHRARER